MARPGIFKEGSRNWRVCFVVRKSLEGTGGCASSISGWSAAENVSGGQLGKSASGTMRRGTENALEDLTGLLEVTESRRFTNLHATADENEGITWIA